MADKLLASDIISGVRGKLDDTAASQTELIRAINGLQSWLFLNHRIRFMEKNDTVSANADETTISLPDDKLTVVRIVLYNTSSEDTATSTDDITRYYLQEEDFMRQYSNFKIANAAKPSYWTDFGNDVRLSAPSDNDYEGYTDYLRKPVVITGTSDELELDTMYEELAVLGTLRRMMKINEDYAEASQETDDMNDLVTAFVRNEGRGQFKAGPTIMNSKRRRTRSPFDD